MSQPTKTELQADLELLRQKYDALESGLRILAVVASGSSLPGIRLVAKQSLNRAAGMKKPV